MQGILVVYRNRLKCYLIVPPKAIWRIVGAGGGSVSGHNFYPGTSKYFSKKTILVLPPPLSPTDPLLFNGSWHNQNSKTNLVSAWSSYLTLHANTNLFSLIITLLFCHIRSNKRLLLFILIKDASFTSDIKLYNSGSEMFLSCSIF